MFKRGSVKGDEGIDITIKNNPDHFLSPNDWDMVMKMRLDKISFEEYKIWYNNLIRERLATRKDEFIALAREGINKEIKLLCYCSKYKKQCHTEIAVDLMNKIANGLKDREKPL